MASDKFSVIPMNILTAFPTEVNKADSKIYLKALSAKNS